MIIHSVTPAYFLKEKTDLPKYEFKKFEGGYLEGYYKDRDFIISRVITTDLKFYIDERYLPGCSFKC